MYWQVYLHKTVMAAEVMLIKIFERAKKLCESGWKPPISPALLQLLKEPLNADSFKKNRLLFYWIGKINLSFLHP